MLFEQVYDYGMSVTQLSTAEPLEARVAEVCGSLNVLNGRLVSLTKEAIETAAWAGHGIRSIEHWLELQAGLSPARAREVVAIAKRSDELPVTMQRLAEGMLSLDQVAPIVKHAPALNDEQVAYLARHATVGQLRSTLKRYSFVPPDEGAAVVGQTFPDPYDPTLAKPSLNMGVRDGRFHLWFDSPVDQGELVEQAVREAKDALFQAGTPDVTLADGLLEVCTRSLSGIESTGRRDKYRIYVHLDTEGAWLNAGPALPATLRDKVTCDAVMVPLWEIGGKPLSVGRSQRIVPARTRRSCEDRDRGCRFPGCKARRNLEVHHLWHWKDGGPTDTWNLACLCPYHHDAHHRGEFTVTGNADEPDGLVFTNPHGLPIQPSSRPRRPDGPPPTPPDGKRYQHPLGDRIQSACVYFSPPPSAA